MDLIEISYNTSMKNSEITYILIKSQRLSNPSKVKSKEGKIQTGKGLGKGPGPKGRSRPKGKDPGPRERVQMWPVFRKVVKDAHQSLCLTQQCQELTERQPGQEYDRDKGTMPETK